MMGGHVAPLFELTHGYVVESTLCGATAVVDSNGKLLHSLGDPNAVAFLSSAAKPFRALPFSEEYRRLEKLGLGLREQALLCGSLEGSTVGIFGAVFRIGQAG